MLPILGVFDIRLVHVYAYCLDVYPCRWFQVGLLDRCHWAKAMADLMIAAVFALKGKTDILPTAAQSLRLVFPVIARISASSMILAAR